MKKIGSKIKKVAALTCLVAASMNAWSGVGEGGGHPLESSVKQKIESIVDDIEYMSPKAKELLKFNYFSLSAIVQLEMNVLCANDEQMKTIKKENKLAWVFKDNSREIRIDCSADSIIQSKWNKKLNSGSYIDDIFFLHEALRAQNILDDDNYTFSSSYAAAYRQNQADENQDIFRLMRTRNNGCALDIYVDEAAGVGVVDLLVKGSVVNSYGMGAAASAREANNNFLNAAGPEDSQARKDILRRARENRCFR